MSAVFEPGALVAEEEGGGEGGGTPPSFTVVCSGAVHETNTLYSTCSRTPTANALQLLAIVTTADDALLPSSLSSTGLTWTLVDPTNGTVQPFINVRLSLYKATAGASPSETDVDVSFSSAQYDFMYAWLECVDVGAGGIVQTAKNTGDGDDQYINVTLNAFAKASNFALGVFVGAAGAGAPASATPGDGFTELSDSYVGNGSSYTVVLQTELKTGQDTSVDATFSAPAYYPAGIALEIDNAATSVLALTQEGYRIRNDDGTETTATWRAAQDTPAIAPAGFNTRIRVLIDASNDPDPQQFQLEYREVGTTSWIKVT